MPAGVSQPRSSQSSGQQLLKTTQAARFVKAEVTPVTGHWWLWSDFLPTAHLQAQCLHWGPLPTAEDI